MPETCENPFFSCTSPEPTKIAIDILYKGQRLPICQDCWQKLADTEIEWTTTSEARKESKCPPQASYK